jgi:hypothetical protein
MAMPLERPQPSTSCSSGTTNRTDNTTPLHNTRYTIAALSPRAVPCRTLARGQPRCAMLHRTGARELICCRCRACPWPAAPAVLLRISLCQWG